MRSIGADSSIECFTAISPEKAAVKACIGPKDGLKPQTIAHGSSPRTKNTAIKSPQARNHLRAFELIVPKTSVLMMALSTDEIVSKNESPMIVIKAEISILVFYYIPSFLSFRKK